MYQIQGYNLTALRWEIMPYQKELDGPEHTTYNIKYMAETVATHWREFCPGVAFRVIEVEE